MVDFTTWDHVHPCIKCNKSTYGNASCNECTELCRQNTGHKMSVVRIIDNNWSEVACRFCGRQELTQCKDPRSRDGFSPLKGYMRGKDE
jgi:hypothetical protein